MGVIIPAPLLMPARAIVASWGGEEKERRGEERGVHTCAGEEFGVGLAK